MSKLIILGSLILSLNMLPPLAAQETLVDEPNPLQKTGTLLNMKGQVLNYRTPEEEQEELTVEPDAGIVLNGKPVKLTDLKTGDKLNMKVREGNPSMVYEIRAARVVITPPDPAPVTPTQRPKDPPMPRPGLEEPVMPESSLGIVVSDSPDKGIMVVGVMPGSPADQGGVLLCDFLLTVNGQEIMTPQDYLKAMGQQPPGKPVKVVAWRGGKSLNGTFQAAAASQFPDMIAVDPRVPLLAALQNQVQSQQPVSNLEVEVVQGAVVVKSVPPNSPAAQAGLLPGDVILGVNGTAVSTLQEWQTTYSGLQPAAAYQLQVNRNNQRQTLNVNPAPRSTDLPGSTRQPEGTFSNPDQGTLPSPNPLDNE